MRPTNFEEMEAHSSGYGVVAGLDEVGRGSIAGPVVAAAIVLPEKLDALWLSEIRDSKKLTPSKREKIFTKAKESNLDCGVGIVSPADVDVLGIVWATKNAMVQAIFNLARQPNFLLIDAISLPEARIPYKSIIKGDEQCISIAAASIIAKVTRDRIMIAEANKFPEYGFEKHKGKQRMRRSNRNKSKHRNKLLLMVEQSLEDSGLLDESTSIIVSVSGGPDSLALMLLLNTLRLEYGFKLCVAHLDHSLREKSAEDVKYVSKISSDLGIPMIHEKWDIRFHSKENSLSIEEAARNIRYDFLSKIARRENAHAIALGHTSDDQVETILMHLIRGSGIGGLTGMNSKSYWPSWSSENRTAIIRPLLNATHVETTEYCVDMGFTPIHDSTNLSDEFTRNSIRLNVVPLLQTYNPRIKESILRLGRSVSQDQSFILAETHKARYEITSRTNTGFSVDRSSFQSMSSSLRNSLLRILYHEISGSYSGLTNRHLQSMLALADGDSGKMLNLPGQIIFSVEYDCLCIDIYTSHPPKIHDKNINHWLLVPGETVLPDWIATASINNHLGHITNEVGHVTDLDLNQMGHNIRLRTRQTGDIFQPLGMTGHKKLGDFLIDSKVPRHLRDNIPLLVSDLGIAWVIGTRVANWAKVTPTTTDVLTVSLSKKTIK